MINAMGSTLIDSEVVLDSILQAMLVFILNQSGSTIFLLTLKQTATILARLETAIALMGTNRRMIMIEAKEMTAKTMISESQSETSVNVGCTLESTMNSAPRTEVLNLQNRLKCSN